MDQPGEDLGLEADLLADFVVGPLPEDLDGHGPLEDLIRGPVDGSHATPP